ncbi:MAG: N-acetylmuramoyl-L-alanine amidase [Phycisphaerae bacterium]|nr:N-acetylmuramoyl-L-alanine amidase [Phycisphaerae bacterium]
MTMSTPSIAVPADARRTVRRTLSVWGVFVLASMLAIGALRVAGTGARTADDSPESKLASRTSPGVVRTNSITPRFADLDRKRWRAIVVHHSGTPGGDSASLERRHVQDGLTGLGYHFIIGNGQGLDDGQVAVGYRWDRQLAGAHVALNSARNAAYYNEHAVAICLVGNGERRAFTERQMHELIALVRQLQASLGIPGAEVHLHSALSGVASPGQFFPTDEFMAQVLP